MISLNDAMKIINSLTASEIVDKTFDEYPEHMQTIYAALNLNTGELFSYGSVDNKQLEDEEIVTLFGRNKNMKFSYDDILTKSEKKILENATVDNPELSIKEVLGISEEELSERKRKAVINRFYKEFDKGKIFKKLYDIYAEGE